MFVSTTRLPDFSEIVAVILPSGEVIFSNSFGIDEYVLNIATQTIKMPTIKISFDFFHNFTSNTLLLIIPQSLTIDNYGG